MKKKRKWVVLLIIAIVFTGSLPLSFDFESDNGDMVNPVKRDFKRMPEGDMEVRLDLSQKNLLSLTKYGFRKKITVKGRIYINLSLQIDATPYNGVNYGIYRDKDLNNPIDEIDLQQQIRRERASDNGIDVEKPRYGLETELDPGEYYVAVYTTHYWDSFRILFTKYFIEL